MADLNGTIMQYFHRYLDNRTADWEKIGQRASELAAAGITALWLPSTVSSDACNVEQKTVEINSGLSDSYLTAIRLLQAARIQTYAHLAFAPDVTDPAVQYQYARWGQQYLQATGVNGFCFDNMRPIQPSGLKQWVQAIRPNSSPPLFLAGEYWTEQVEPLHQYLRVTDGHLSLLDVPLHYNFYRASRAGGYYDMSKLLKGSLMQQQPALAVTFVENHHSQPLCRFESVVEPWFKPLAYAVILLRREGYPCLFYADYYGAHYRDQGQDGRTHEIWLDCHRWLLDKFLYARQYYAYGKQDDYFDHDSVVGWTRLGNSEHPKTMAVLMSDGWGGSKWMDMGQPNAAFYDLTEHIREPVYTNEYGWGEFHCRGGSVSVWLEE